MGPAQRAAWFNLAVIAAAVIAVAALTPRLGYARAQGGFGLLGLLGFGPLFFRRRGGRVVLDERDGMILRRSTILGHSAFWLAFVAACVAAPWVYGARGAVPVIVVQSGVWWGLVLVFAVSSTATLIQYALGGGDGSDSET
jgi:hypothetical protein